MFGLLIKNATVYDGRLVLKDNEPTGTYIGTYLKRQNPQRV